MIKSAPAVAFAVAAFQFVPANPAAAGLVAIHTHAHTYHRHHHSNGFWPYGGVVATEPTSGVVPALIGPAIAQTPACTSSRETKAVPSEAGGEKQITIMRCY